MSNQYAAADTEWLTLSDASKLLGVHPSTLRQWCDEGRITAFRTPGGHRRFSRVEVERFLSSSAGLKPTANVPKLFMEQALTNTRSEASASLPLATWARDDAAWRERKRQMGRRLMGIMVQFMSRRNAEESLLQEARDLGRAYGSDLASEGTTLPEAVMAFMLFRDSVLETIFQLPDTSGLDRDESLHMFHRLSGLMNQVLAAMMDAHSEAEPVSAYRKIK
jgi:excisionase family DNA binding protein